MPTAYIVDAVRTAGGRRGGRLAGVHPVDLLAKSLDAIVERSGVDPKAIDDVVTGCVSQAGEQAMQVARMGVLASKLLPQSTPAVTIDRQCGSSQQAIQFAAQAVMSGTQDIVIASGVESMTRVPMGTNATFHMKEGLGHYKSPGLEEKYPGIQFSQFMGAEMIAKKHDFSKDMLDQFSLDSHKKAIAATEAGAFDNEIVPIRIDTPEGEEMHTVDEGIRFDATLEGIAIEMSRSPIGAPYLLHLAGRNELPEIFFPIITQHIHDNPDASVRALASRYFPRPSANGEPLPPIDNIANLAGDPAKGRDLFFGRAVCATCHLYGEEGRDIGPNLTTVGERFDRVAILDSIINPSAAIAFGYESVILETVDGQTLSGFVVGDGDPVILKDVGGQQHSIVKEEIRSRQELSQSIMPAGGALGLSAQDLADLLTFLAGN